MLNKISAYAILIIISGSMTACSNNQAPKTVVSSVKSVKNIQRQHRVESVDTTKAVRRVPVVIEKRSPPARSSIVATARHYAPQRRRSYARVQAVSRRHYSPRPRQLIRNNSFSSNLSSAALGRLHSRVRYDGSYVKIPYPWGDVPANIGVCTDVVIRSYRRLGIDLQQQVHNDMNAAFSSYPNVKKWGLSQPDPNIDHRRVYNLKTFFTRRGAALPVTHNPYHYKPGDLVTWMVGKDLPHIGIVVNKRSPADPNRFMIVHNIANGPELDDVLFRFPITGHYRYTPAQMRNIPKASVFASRSRVNRHNNQNQLSYSQLVAAAKRLGAQPSRSNNRHNRSAAAKARKTDRRITLANMTNIEMNTIMNR